jgi:hypothetical protein
MRRPAAILILLLLTSCRFYDNGKRAAATAVVYSVLHLQAHAPLTQSVSRPAVVAPGPSGRLIAFNVNAKALPARLGRCQAYTLRRLQRRWDGMRSARLNFADAFSQAMISVSSTMASSPKKACTRAKSASVTSLSERLIASAYSSAARS